VADGKINLHNRVKKKQRMRREWVVVVVVAEVFAPDGNSTAVL
jgi:hypothetical protein